MRRNSGSGVSPTGPVSRQAVKPPSHRVDEPPSPRAPGKRAHLVHANPDDYSRRTTRMRCPDTAVFRLSPPLIARPLNALGHSQWPVFAGATPQPARQRLNSSFPRAIRPPDRCGRFRAVRDSPSDVVACQRVVRIHTRSPVTRRPTTRATQARAAPGVHVGQLAPKTSSKASHEARNWREECEVLDAGLAEVLNSSCHVMPRHILMILAGRFRDRVDLPKKNPTWGLA